MKINGQIFSEDILERIRYSVKTEADLSRRELSLRVCQWLGWQRSNGKPKDMSCRVALLKLEKKGVIELPVVKHMPGRSTETENIDVFQERVEEANNENNEISKENNIYPWNQKIECSLSELGELSILRVESKERETWKTWKEMMERYHYLGSGPLCGGQIRYIVESKRYGYIGGFAFSSAAWELESRNQWIGWDKEAQKKNLEKIVCNSRFLIIPQVRVKYLASHLLSVIVKRLAKDWKEIYGVAPVLLETFVETERYKATSYRAGNWKHIGKTKGRGRQDKENRYPKTIKDVYVYELKKNSKEILRDGRIKEVKEEKKPDDWAEEEFGKAKLGDKRRAERLVKIARDFYSNPEANIPQASRSRASAKAAYRFFDEPENTMEKILAPHIQSTYNRIKEEKVVLSIQDTTFLNYSAHPATEGLGPIRNNGDGCIGLVVHDTMAFNLEGTPLGLLDVQAWSRDPKEIGKKALRANLPIEQRESNKWLKSFNAAQEAQRQNPNTLVVSVGDRESDIYELFELALREKNGAKILVRAEHNRILSDGQGYLWDYVASQTIAGIRQVQVPGKDKQKAREAKMEVRFSKVRLRQPKRKKQLGELTVWAILAEEKEAPEGIEPLKWMLITTIEVNTFEQAMEKLDWYSLRFWIEVYHRTLKSGCKIENRQLGSASRIETCLAIDMVVAWRILHLTKLGRETPNVPCTVYFSDIEWKALVAHKTRHPIPPKQPPVLREAIHMVARLGGFLGRKSDGEPGTKSLWLGLQTLDGITEMYEACMSFFAPEYLRPPPVPG